MLLTLLFPAWSVAQVITYGPNGNQFQSYTVPVAGWYFLDAQGGQGGPASNNSHQGGRGARMQGYAFLLAGDVLRIAVGGSGARGQGDGNNVSGGGGGGGSSIFLVDGSNYVPLLMAGGGGGAAANYDGSPGLSTTSGGSTLGGVSGNGGGIGADKFGGAGGAGYLTDGGTHYDGSTVLSYGGQAYLSGNFGGSSGRNGGGGGWGGGGSGGPALRGLVNKDGGGGGGGGYSGGGGGANEGDGGGGGGSYVAASLDTMLCLAAQDYRTGDGLVEITPVGGPPVIAQPADQQVAIGGSVTLGPVYSDPTATYQWMKDGVVLAGQTAASLSIASFQFPNSGRYQVVVYQGQGTFITQPAFLTCSTPQSTLQGWGYNEHGELGLGDENDRTAPTYVASDVVAVSCSYHSMFVKRDGTLWAMGNNPEGQLGLGDTNNRMTPTYVASDVVGVAAGTQHSLFVRRDGTLWAMGENSVGELGLGDTDRRKTPTYVASDVVVAAAGTYHSMFVKRDGTLWGMGRNEYGMLGLGDTNARTTPTEVYFRSAANLPTVPVQVATVPAMPLASHSLAITAPAPTGLQLSASNGGANVPNGIFQLMLQEVPTRDYAEAIVSNQVAGWRAEAVLWHDQATVHFAVRFQRFSGVRKDITVFGLFPRGEPENADFLALNTADLRQIGVQPSSVASNQAKYHAFRRLMSSASLEQLEQRWNGFLQLGLGVCYYW